MSRTRLNKLEQAEAKLISDPKLFSIVKQIKQSIQNAELRGKAQSKEHSELNDVLSSPATQLINIFNSINKNTDKLISIKTACFDVANIAYDLDKQINGWYDSVPGAAHIDQLKEKLQTPKATYAKLLQERSSQKSNGLDVIPVNLGFDVLRASLLNIQVILNECDLKITYEKNKELLNSAVDLHDKVFQCLNATENQLLPYVEKITKQMRSLIVTSENNIKAMIIDYNKMADDVAKRFNEEKNNNHLLKEESKAAPLGSKDSSAAEIAHARHLQNILYVKKQVDYNSSELIPELLQSAKTDLLALLQTINDIITTADESGNPVSNKQDQIGEHIQKVHPLLLSLQELKNKNDIGINLSEQFNTLKKYMDERKSSNLDTMPSLESLPAKGLFIVCLSIAANLETKLSLKRDEQKNINTLKAAINSALNNLETAKKNHRVLGDRLTSQDNSFKEVEISWKLFQSSYYQASQITTVKKDSPSSSANQAGKNSNSKSSEESKDSPPKMALHADLSQVDDILEHKENFFNDDQPGAPKQAIQANQPIKYNPQVRAIFQKDLSAEALSPAQLNRPLSNNAQLQNIFKVSPAENNVKQISIKPARQEVNIASNPEIKAQASNPSVSSAVLDRSALFKSADCTPENLSKEQLLARLKQLEDEFIVRDDAYKAYDKEIDDIRANGLIPDKKLYLELERLLSSKGETMDKHRGYVSVYTEKYGYFRDENGGTCSYKHLSKMFPERFHQSTTIKNTTNCKQCITM